MKTILKIAIAIVLLLNVVNLFSQAITVNVSQDAKLLFVGDDHGNPAGTPDFQISSEWRGHERNGYYIFVRPEFEYARLSEVDFRRYSGNVGITFTELTPLFHYTTSIGYGFVDFYGSRFSWGANFQISYEVTDGFEIFLDWQIIEREDLLFWKSTKEILGTAWRGSGLFGVKITVFRPKGR